jgi:myo-inositol-1(or 4)-monophosphatase
MVGVSVNLHDVLDAHPLAGIAWQAAQDAATFLVEERPADLPIETKSTPTDAVTAMDRGAELRIVDRIRAARPDDAVLGEEGGSRPGTSGVRWIVDPLDGTVNYTYRIPAWGVSIAAEVDGVVEVGVVITPALGSASVAVRGHGSWGIDQGAIRPLRVSACADLATALVATGFGYRSQVRHAQGLVAGELLPSIRDIRRTGCAVVDFSWLARGWTDGYYESGLNPWDYAAGALIAAEAGAVVRGLDGPDPTVGVLVAATPGIVDPLVARLRELGAS